jgi:putative ABC transport system permease protein
LVNLTIKDLMHHKGKFILILLGMTMSIFLVQYSAAMWNGVLTKSSEVTDKSGYDAWIREKDSDTIFGGGTVNESVYEQVRLISGIKESERLILTGALVEDKDYSLDCYVIGYELNSKKIEPWDVYKGHIKDLEKENAIIVDESFKKSFNNLEIGAKLSIGHIDMKIVGFCKNARFMGNPYVWMSIETAKKIAPWAGNWSTTIGIDFKKSYSIDDLKKDIDTLVDKNIIDEVNILSTIELRENTYSYIVNEAGMGGSILILVIMGYFVAMIIISVSTYQTIQEKIPEFGTLKAIGASKGYLNRMLLGQVFIYVSLSFALGTFLTWLFGIIMGPNSIIPVLIHIPTSFILYGLTLVICLGCSLLSIRKVHKIDPAIVFRS